MADLGRALAGWVPISGIITPRRSTDGPARWYGRAGYAGRRSDRQASFHRFTVFAPAEMGCMAPARCTHTHTTTPEVEAFALLAPPDCGDEPLPQHVAVRTVPAFDRPLQASAREIGLLERPPWVRSPGKLDLTVTTQGWKFPVPGEPAALQVVRPEPAAPPVRRGPHALPPPPLPAPPPGDWVLFRPRLLSLPHPPLKNLFASRQVELPFQPY